MICKYVFLKQLYTQYIIHIMVLSIMKGIQEVFIINNLECET